MHHSRLRGKELQRQQKDFLLPKSSAFNVSIVSKAKRNLLKEYLYPKSEQPHFFIKYEDLDVTKCVAGGGLTGTCEHRA